MKVFKPKLINLTMALLSLSSINVAASTIINQVTFINDNCEDTQTCDLESFFIKTTSKIHDQQGLTYMTGGFTTKSNLALKSYAIVQFHQGCIYQENAGKTELLHRTYMGVKGVPFIHHEMSVDSADDADPIYQSSPRGGLDDGFGYIYPRKEYYNIFEPDLVNGNDQQDSYMNHLDNPEVRSLYVSDVPSVTDLNINQISSLNFVTCIYKMEDVPRRLTNTTRSNFKEAIKCIDWNHNFKKTISNRLERTTEIDQVCRKGEK